MYTISTKHNGAVLIKGQPYQIGDLIVKFTADGIIIYHELNRRVPILEAAYTEITDPGSGAPFASLSALKEFAQDNFFDDASGSGGGVTEEDLDEAIGEVNARITELHKPPKQVTVTQEAPLKFFAVTMRRAGDVAPPFNATGLHYALNNGVSVPMTIVEDSYWAEGDISYDFDDWARSNELTAFNGEDIRISITAPTSDYLVSVTYFDEGRNFVRRESWFPVSHVFNIFDPLVYHSLEDMFATETAGNTLITVKAGRYYCLNARFYMLDGWELRGEGEGCTEIIFEYDREVIVNDVDGFFGQANAKISNLSLTSINSNVGANDKTIYALHIDKVGTFSILIENVYFKSVIKYADEVPANNNTCNLIGLGSHDRQRIHFKNCYLEAQTLDKGDKNIGNTHNSVSEESIPANITFEGCTYVGGFAPLLAADININAEFTSIRNKTVYNLIACNIPLIKFKSFDPNTRLIARTNGFKFNASGSQIAEFVTPHEVADPYRENYEASSLPVTNDIGFMHVLPAPETVTDDISIEWDSYWDEDNTNNPFPGWARSVDFFQKQSSRAFIVLATTTLPDLVVAVNFLKPDGTAYFRDFWGAANEYAFMPPTDSTQFGITLKSASDIPVTSANVTSVKIFYAPEVEKPLTLIKGSYYNHEGVLQTAQGEQWGRADTFVMISGCPFSLKVNETMYRDFEFAVWYTDIDNQAIGAERYYSSRHYFNPPEGAVRAYINTRRKNILPWDELEISGISFKTAEAVPRGAFVAYVMGERFVHWYDQEGNEYVRNVPVALEPLSAANYKKFAGVLLVDAVSGKPAHIKTKGLVNTSAEVPGDVGEYLCFNSNGDLVSSGLDGVGRVSIARKNATETVIYIN